MYVLMEGTDAQVHYISHTAEITRAWSQGLLRPNSFVRPGDSVKQGDIVGLLRIGRIYAPVMAPVDGIVTAIRARHEKPVGFGTCLVDIRPASPSGAAGGNDSHSHVGLEDGAPARARRFQRDSDLHRQSTVPGRPSGHRENLARVELVLDLAVAFEREIVRERVVVMRLRRGCHRRLG